MHNKRRETRELPLAAHARHGAPVAIRIVRDGKEAHFSLADRERFTIGSDDGNDLVLDEPHVSSQHCAIERRGNTFLVRDRRSKNGTFVNGVRVAESELDTGCRLVVGGVAVSLVGRPRAGERDARAALIGQAPIFLAAIETARRAARSSATILLHGESGTGKELFARLVHEASHRADGPFVAINCGAIPDNLAESQLFGHEKGAFTGADARHQGVFEQADGGTLFLDEIAELPTSQQRKLLRVLETRRLTRVGGKGELAVDVRVVAASHARLEERIIDGSFREDLFYRLAGVRIALPALRERASDIPALVLAFLDRFAPGSGRRRIDDRTLAALAAEAWPGNVCQLRQAVETALALTDGPLELAHFLSPGERPVPFTRLAAGGTAAGMSRDDFERLQLGEALRRHGSQRAAAAALGMKRSTFHEKVHRLGLLPRRHFG